MKNKEFWIVFAVAMIVIGAFNYFMFGNVNQSYIIGCFVGAYIGRKN